MLQPLSAAPAGNGGGCGAGAVGAVVGELTAQYASNTGMTDPAAITALARVMSATAGLLVSGGDATAVNAAASMGANAAQNNALAHSQANAITNSIKNCAGNTQCINDTVYNATLLSDSQGNSITQSSAKSAIAVLGSLLTDPTITLSPDNQRAIASLMNKNASDYYVAPSNVPSIATGDASLGQSANTNPSQQSVVVGGSVYSPYIANCPLGCADATAYALNNPQTNAYVNAVNYNTASNGVKIATGAAGLGAGLVVGTAAEVYLTSASVLGTIGGYGVDYSYIGKMPSAGTIAWDAASAIIPTRLPQTPSIQTGAAAVGILGSNYVPPVLNQIPGAVIQFNNQLNPQLNNSAAKPAASK